MKGIWFACVIGGLIIALLAVADFLPSGPPGPNCR